MSKRVHPNPIAQCLQHNFAGRLKIKSLALSVCLLSGSVSAEEIARCATSAARIDSLEGQVQWQATGETQWHGAILGQTFCYGDTLIVSEKRAVLRLSNNTLVRLNEHSSLKLIPPDQSFWVELIDGAAHVLTRTPKSFTVKAPYVNAAVEGTEFLVSAQNGVNKVGVIEGKVRSGNAAGSVLLTQGQSTQTSGSNQAPGAPVQLKLNDFVSWAMYFPPLPNRLNVPADIKNHLDKGEDGEVIKQITQDAQASAEMLSLGAALSLNRGQLPEAQALVERALKLSPKHPDAQAIAALIDLGRGESERGRQRAAQNVLDNPFNPTAIIAHSYSQQAEGRLQAALDSALEAQRLAPNDSQITARVAELYLSLGQKEPARKALDQALVQSPNHSRLLTFKGFSLLAERKAKQAQGYFSKASTLDSADPYAQLGWGMSLIQRGKLEAGREHLELAVILDPANSVMRSYLGKGYFEENRLKLAETQLNLAQTLDPNDPTPWYYLSQVKHDQNHYGEALQLIDTAIDKNANRAVYREEGAIDSDAATRIADKARIYQAMGAEQMAITTASDAIRTDPNDYAGHRAMAMALTGKEGAQTARANEALQASLLAPIGAMPLAPGFAETAMQVLPGAGPHEMGINEYNSAFTPNGINGFVSVLGAGNNTRATEGQVHAVDENGAVTLGQYNYSSDGFGVGADRDYLINQGMVQYEPLDFLRVQVGAIQRKDNTGNLTAHTDAVTAPEGRFVQDTLSNHIAFNWRDLWGGNMLGYFKKSNYFNSSDLNAGDPRSEVDLKFLDKSDEVARQAEVAYWGHWEGVDFKLGYKNVSRDLSSVSEYRELNKSTAEVEYTEITPSKKDLGYKRSYSEISILEPVPGVSVLAGAGRTEINDSSAGDKTMNKWGVEYAYNSQLTASMRGSKDVSTGPENREGFESSNIVGNNLAPDLGTFVAFDTLGFDVKYNSAMWFAQLLSTYTDFEGNAYLINENGSLKTIKIPYSNDRQEVVLGFYPIANVTANLGYIFESGQEPELNDAIIFANVPHSLNTKSLPVDIRYFPGREWMVRMSYANIMQRAVYRDGITDNFNEFRKSLNYVDLMLSFHRGGLELKASVLNVTNAKVEILQHGIVGETGAAIMERDRYVANRTPMVEVKLKF